MENEHQNSSKEIQVSQQREIQPHLLQNQWKKRVENIIYNIYIAQKHIQSPKTPIIISKGSSEIHQDKKQLHRDDIWEEFRKQFNISMAATVNQLYINERLIQHVIHFLAGLPFIQNSKKIIKSIVQYYDPSRSFIKSLIQSLVPVLQNQEKSELNRINVILYTLNNLFMQQSPQNSKFNSCIYLHGGQGIKVQEKVKWPFEKSGTICLWYNMSKDTKQCKLFEISGEKSGFDIVLKNKKIYFEKIKEQRGFNILRNDSAFLCEAEYNTDVRFQIEFEIKKKIFQKALFINVNMNNFVLNGIELDIFTPTLSDYNITLFKNFHGKISSALIFTNNFAKEVENLNSKQGFLYESDIRNFVCMFDSVLKHVFLLYTAIRAKTYTNQDQILQNQQKQEQKKNQEKIQGEQNDSIFNKSLEPVKTILFDAINRRNGIIGPQGSVYRNISIHKKEMALYGGLHTYVGFLNVLKIHSKNATQNIHLYTSALGEVIMLFKNIFLSKAASIEQSQGIKLFRILSNFFVETEMVGYTEEITPKLKQLYVALNNRIMKQKFIKKVIWGIPAGEFLELPQLQNYLNLAKGLYLEQIQNSLNIFNVKDIINFIFDRYDRINCCFEHTRSSSIDYHKKIKKYPQVLAEYFKIIETIVEIKRYDNDIATITQQIISSFHCNASACFIEAVVIFLNNLFDKDQGIQNYFKEQFQTVHQAKMGLFTTLANTNCWKIKAILIKLILRIYGVKMFRPNGQKDLLGLCIRFPTINPRVSSIKSQDIDRSVDFSEDKFSFNSTNVRTIMAMRPLSYEQYAQLNDQQIVKVIWQWGTTTNFQEYYLGEKGDEGDKKDKENPAVLLLADLYKGSTYKIRKMISQIFLSNHDLLALTADLMTWVIQCLLLCECDSNSMIKSDQILYKTIEETKANLLKLISIYRMDTQGEEQQAFKSQIDIFKLILISVKSKYSTEVSQYQHRIFLLISKEVIHSLYLQLKETKFEEQGKYEQKIKHILSNCYKCIIEHFIKNGNEDIIEFQDEGGMEKIEQQRLILLNIIQQIFQILLHLASPGNNTLMEDANSKRNQAIFQNLFSEQSHNGQGTFLYEIFAILQNMYDEYDDIENISQKKLALTLIKKYLIFLIEISENSGNLKIQKYEEIIKNIFLNTLGFFQAKFYHCTYSEDSIKISQFKNTNELKNMLVNIFLQLLQLMKFIEESSCAKHKSFYELMKPKKKHKNMNIIKNIFPTIWRKVDQKVIQFISLNVETLKNEQARNKLQEHLKQQRLFREVKPIERAITKIIDKKKDEEKKASQEIQKKSVFSYQNNQAEKCKILTQFEESVAMFMFQNNNRQNNQSQQRKIQQEAIKRNTKNQEQKLWKLNRVYEGFWANQNFYSYSQNIETFLYDNTLSNFYKRVRSQRQSKYLLQPFISIQPKESESLQLKYGDEQIFTNDFVEDEGEKNTQNQRRKSDKYIQVGFQFLKKKVIQKIKKSALLNKQKSEELSQKKLQVFYFKEVLLVQPMKVSVGNLKIDQNMLQFQYRPSSHLQHISLLKNRQSINDLLTRRWSLNEIQSYQQKKFMLKANSIQLYFKQKYSVFFSFYGNSEASFAKFLELIQKIRKIDYSIQKIAYPLKLFDPCKYTDKFQVTESWKNREISNFQYLLCLNILSGRSNSDLNQYFIFPWILADYRSSKFKKDQNKYRDLQKNMGSLGSFERIQKFIEIKNNIEQNLKEQFSQPHFFGFHYSNLPIVLQYLVRLYPYAEGSIQLQGGKFDIPDRLFISINDAFKNATTQMSDVRELIPQFYYFPQFLINGQNFDFGVQQNNERVDNVQIPDGYSNAYDFIEVHREQLESQQVSQNLHKWIDLIWGYKQYGKQAQSSYNKFHYLSYEANAPIIFQEEKLQNKSSIETHICYFGKVPSQIFTKPHPKRNPLPNICLSQYTEGYTRANLFINEKPLPQNVLQQMIRHQTGIFSYQNQACIHFRYSQSNKKYLLLRRDGRGVIFQNEKSDYTKDLSYQRYLSITTPIYFNIFIDKYEFTYIFDESINFEKFPIASLWGEYLFFGGLWGGKIWSYDIITKDELPHCKHSDTVTAIVADQQLSVVVSGAINGQIIVWQFVCKSNLNPTNLTLTHVPYTHASRKLIYKNKIVTHYKKINKISINADLRVAVCSSQDGLVSLIDIQRYEVIRVIKMGIPIQNALILNYPYYMVFISCKQNKQYCFSINGQMLDQSNLQNLHEDIRICVVNGYQQRVVIKKQNETYFSVLKLPQMREETKVQIKKDDNEILEFEVSTNQIDIQILFNTPTHLVHCSNNLVPLTTGKSRYGKKNNHSISN